jgi:hypothetical protein
MCTKLRAGIVLLAASTGLAMVPSFGQTKSVSVPSKSANSRNARPAGAMTAQHGDAARLRAMSAGNDQKAVPNDGGIQGDNPACGGGGDCCVAGVGPGCLDPVCCNTICDCDPFCCSAVWDAYCAGAGFVPGCGAQILCPECVPGPCDPPNPNEDCTTATNGGLLPIGGSIVFSGTAVCAVPDCPEFTFGLGNLWITFETTDTRNITVSYCGSTNSGGGPWGNAWLNLSQSCLAAPCTFTGAGQFAFDCPDGNLNITWQNMPAGVYFYPVLIDPANSAEGNYLITVSSVEGVPVCPNLTHDCCTTGTPGCADQPCCELVCALDPFCCQVAWDTICVGEAEVNCTSSGKFVYPCPLPCPNPDHDCCTTGTPGCSDQACCELVCGLDPFCCDVAWDTICVGEAAANGCCPPPPNDNCADRIDIGEVCQMAFTTVGATTDGPSHGSCVDVAGDGFVNNDIWYNYTASCTGDVTVSLCGSLYDTKLAVYDGCSCDVSDANKLACNDDFCGLQSQVSFPAIAGNCYKIRIGAFGLAFGNGSLTINNSGTPCTPTPNCPADLNNDNVVNTLDLLDLIEQWGVCPP